MVLVFCLIQYVVFGTLSFCEQALSFIILGLVFCTVFFLVHIDKH